MCVCVGRPRPEHARYDSGRPAHARYIQSRARYIEITDITDVAKIADVTDVTDAMLMRLI